MCITTFLTHHPLALDPAKKPGSARKREDRLTEASRTEVPSRSVHEAAPLIYHEGQLAVVQAWEHADPFGEYVVCSLDDNPS